MAGIVFPAIAYLLTSSPLQAWVSDKPLGFYAVAALVNLILVRYLYRNNGEKTAQGIILITFVAVLVLLITQKVTV